MMMGSMATTKSGNTAATSTPSSSPSSSLPHVVVVGGGLAGASAALEAADAIREKASKGRVTLLDKAERVGGNSAKASSGLSAAAAAALVETDDAKTEDSESLFESDLLSSAQDRGDPKLASVLAKDSATALPWLRSRLGVDLPSIVRLGGHSAARTRGPSGGAPVGVVLMKAAAAALEGDELVEVRTGVKVVGLETTEAGEVSGIVVVEESSPSTSSSSSTSTLRADAVVLATGGYASAPDLLARFAPEALAASGGGRTTNGPWATGDAFEIVTSSCPSSPSASAPARRSLGAKLVDLDAVQLHPTAFAPFVAAAKSSSAADDDDDDDAAEGAQKPISSSSNAFLAPERLRGVGGILLDGRGRRFFDELARRDAVAAAVGEAEAQTGGAWLVLSDAAVQNYGRAAVGFYVSKGLMKEVAGVEELAKVIASEGGGRGGEGGSEEQQVAGGIEAALREHDAAAEGGSLLADPFGRSSFASGAFGSSGPFFVGKIGPALHYTMGGLAIDTEGRVLKEEEEKERGGEGERGRGGANNNDETESETLVIPGLYAAGEAAGGIHGANRLGGCSLADCVVFGRRAGRAAVADWLKR